jgi:hypothetical protein
MKLQSRIGKQSDHHRANFQFCSNIREPELQAPVVGKNGGVSPPPSMMMCPSFHEQRRILVP